MKKDYKVSELISIRTLDEQKDDLDEKEKRTPYSQELRLFSCIQQGDIEALLRQLGSLDSIIVTGKMSDNELMQYKYMAVSTITLATRYAIQGGMNENKAYEFSDRVIGIVDKLSDKEEIMVTIGTEIINLTDEVKKNKIQPGFSPHVRRCIKYINENINEKITVSMLAAHCGISADYLSSVFKKEMNENLRNYILRQKLEKSKIILLQKNENSTTVYSKLGFLSQSHFSTAFKRFYSMTPSDYIRLSEKGKDSNSE